MDITQYVIAAILSALICVLFSVLGKLLLNLIALKTVSAIFKKSDDMIFKKTFKRAYGFGLLADLIGYLLAVAVVVIISGIEAGFCYIDILSILIYLFMFFACPFDNRWETWFFVIIAAVISMLVTFILNYFIILKETNLSKKQRLISALIIALITAPYYFLIPLDWGQGLP